MPASLPKFKRGFIDIISLLTVGLLTLGLVLATVTITNTSDPLAVLSFAWDQKDIVSSNDARIRQAERRAAREGVKCKGANCPAALAAAAKAKADAAAEKEVFEKARTEQAKQKLIEKNEDQPETTSLDKSKSIYQQKPQTSAPATEAKTEAKQNNQLATFLAAPALTDSKRAALQYCNSAFSNSGARRDCNRTTDLTNFVKETKPEIVDQANKLNLYYAASGITKLNSDNFAAFRKTQSHPLSSQGDDYTQQEYAKNKLREVDQELFTQLPPSLEDQKADLNRCRSLSSQYGGECVVRADGFTHRNDTLAPVEKVDLDDIGNNQQIVSPGKFQHIELTPCGGAGSPACKTENGSKCNSGLSEYNGTCHSGSTPATKAEAVTEYVKDYLTANNNQIALETLNAIVASNKAALLQPGSINDFASALADKIPDLCADKSGACAYSSKTKQFVTVNPDTPSNDYISIAQQLNPNISPTDSIDGNLNQPCAQKHWYGPRKYCNNSALECSGGGGGNGTCKLTKDAQALVASRTANSGSLDGEDFSLELLTPNNSLVTDINIVASGCGTSGTTYSQHGHYYLCISPEKKSVQEISPAMYARSEEVEALFAALPEKTGLSEEQIALAFNSNYANGQLATHIQNNFHMNVFPIVDQITEMIINSALAPIIRSLTPSYGFTSSIGKILNPSFSDAPDIQQKVMLTIAGQLGDNDINQETVDLLSPNARLKAHLAIADNLIANQPSQDAGDPLKGKISAIEQSDAQILYDYKTLGNLSIFTSAWTENTGAAVQQGLGANTSQNQVFLNYAATYADPNATALQKLGSSTGFGFEVGLVAADFFAPVYDLARSPAQYGIKEGARGFSRIAAAVPLAFADNIIPIYSLSRGVYEIGQDIAAKWIKGSTAVVEQAAQEAAEKEAKEIVQKTVKETAEMETATWQRWLENKRTLYQNGDLQAAEDALQASLLRQDDTALKQVESDLSDLAFEKSNERDYMNLTAEEQLKMNTTIDAINKKITQLQQLVADQAVPAAPNAALPANIPAAVAPAPAANNLNQNIILTNNGFASGPSVNNNLQINPFEDQWLDETSNLLVRSNKTDDPDVFFGNASEELQSLYPNTNTENQKIIRSSLIFSDQPSQLQVGDIISCGSEPVCFEKIAVLHTAGAKTGHPSFIVSAFPENSGTGHTWLEFTDDSGDWVIDPIHFKDTQVVSKEVAYDYYAHNLLNLDLNNIKKTQYVIPNPNPVAEIISEIPHQSSKFTYSQISIRPSEAPDIRTAKIVYQPFEGSDLKLTTNSETNRVFLSDGREIIPGEPFDVNGKNYVTTYPNSSVEFQLHEQLEITQETTHVATNALPAPTDLLANLKDRAQDLWNNLPGRAPAPASTTELADVSLTLTNSKTHNLSLAQAGQDVKIKAENLEIFENDAWKSVDEASLVPDGGRIRLNRESAEIYTVSTKCSVCLINEKKFTTTKVLDTDGRLKTIQKNITVALAGTKKPLDKTVASIVKAGGNFSNHDLIAALIDSGIHPTKITPDLLIQFNDAYKIANPAAIAQEAAKVTEDVAQRANEVGKTTPQTLPKWEPNDKIAAAISSNQLTPENLHQKLESLPSSRDNVFRTVHETEKVNLTNTEIPVDQIVGSNGNSLGKNWDVWDNNTEPPEYLEKMTFGLRDGQLTIDQLSKKDPSALVEIGGVYYVTSGQHRIASAKALDYKTIPINSVEIITKIKTVSAFSEEGYDILIARQKQGLWDGQLIQKQTKDGRFYAEWEVTEIEGPWVFANDIDQSKSMYLTVRPDLYELTPEGKVVYKGSPDNLLSPMTTKTIIEPPAAGNMAQNLPVPAAPTDLSSWWQNKIRAANGTWFPSFKTITPEQRTLIIILEEYDKYGSRIKKALDLAKTGKEGTQQAFETLKAIAEEKGLTVKLVNEETVEVITGGKATIQQLSGQNAARISADGKTLFVLEHPNITGFPHNIEDVAHDVGAIVTGGKITPQGLTNSFTPEFLAKYNLPQPVIDKLINQESGKIPSTWLFDDLVNGKISKDSLAQNLPAPAAPTGSWFNRNIWNSDAGLFPAFQEKIKIIFNPRPAEQLAQEVTETATTNARNLTTSEQKLFTNQAKNPPFQTTKKLLSNKELQPTAVINLPDGRKTYISQVIFTPEGERYYAVIYSQNQNGEILPRLVWKSKSGGEWSATNGFTGIIGKGKNIHYSQELRLYEPIAEFLESIKDKAYTQNSNSLNLLSDYFNLYYIEKNPAEALLNTYNAEISAFDDNGALSSLQKFMPGSYKHEEFIDVDFSNNFKSFDYPPQFVPDFTQKPIKTRQTTHELLGKTTLETYESSLNGHPITWVMAYNDEGKVWVHQIYLKNTKVSTYGNFTEVINSGALTNKPYEYFDQTGNLKDGVEFVRLPNSTYADITPLLDQLQPIQDFRAAKNISRKISIGEEKQLFVNATYTDILQKIKSNQELLSHSKLNKAEWNKNSNWHQSIYFPLWSTKNYVPDFENTIGKLLEKINKNIDSTKDITKDLNQLIELVQKNIDHSVSKPAPLNQTLTLPAAADQLARQANDAFQATAVKTTGNKTIPIDLKEGSRSIISNIEEISYRNDNLRFSIVHDTTNGDYYLKYFDEVGQKNVRTRIIQQQFEFDGEIYIFSAGPQGKPTLYKSIPDTPATATPVKPNLITHQPTDSIPLGRNHQTQSLTSQFISRDQAEIKSVNGELRLFNNSNKGTSYLDTDGNSIKIGPAGHPIANTEFYFGDFIPTRITVENGQIFLVRSDSNLGINVKELIGHLADDGNISLPSRFEKAREVTSQAIFSPSSFFQKYKKPIVFVTVGTTVGIIIYNIRHWVTDSAIPAITGTPPPPSTGTATPTAPITPTDTAIPPTGTAVPPTATITPPPLEVEYQGQLLLDQIPPGAEYDKLRIAIIFADAVREFEASNLTKDSAIFREFIKTRFETYDNGQYASLLQNKDFLYSLDQVSYGYRLVEGKAVSCIYGMVFFEGIPDSNFAKISSYSFQLDPSGSDYFGILELIKQQGQENKEFGWQNFLKWYSQNLQQNLKVNVGENTAYRFVDTTYRAIDMLQPGDVLFNGIHVNGLMDIKIDPRDKKSLIFFVTESNNPQSGDNGLPEVKILNESQFLAMFGGNLDKTIILRKHGGDPFLVADVNNLPKLPEKNTAAENFINLLDQNQSISTPQANHDNQPISLNPSNSSNTSELPYFNQFKDDLTNVKLAPGKTGKDIGCGFFTGAMIMHTEDNPITPTDYLKIYKDHNYTIGEKGTNFETQHLPLLKKLKYDVYPITGPVENQKVQIEKFLNSGWRIWVNSEVYTKTGGWQGHMNMAVDVVPGPDGSIENGTIIYYDSVLGKGVPIEDKYQQKYVSKKDKKEYNWDDWTVYAVKPDDDIQPIINQE